MRPTVVAATVAPKVPQVASNPCMPSPCGGNSECRVLDHRPVCSCLPGMLGAPPNCRPECLIHADCPTRLACIGSKCKNPCAGSCGFNTVCNVVNHQPLCTCQPGYQGDPFSGCSQGKSLFRRLHLSFNLNTTNVQTISLFLRDLLCAGCSHRF